MCHNIDQHIATNSANDTRMVPDDMNFGWIHSMKMSNTHLAKRLVIIVVTFVRLNLLHSRDTLPVSLPMQKGVVLGYFSMNDVL